MCVDLDFMKEIVASAAHHGTMVVHDFAYADLGFDGYKPPSILQVEGAEGSGRRDFLACRRATTWRAGAWASAWAIRR